MSASLRLTADDVGFLDRASVVECQPAAWRRERRELLDAVRDVRQRLGSPAIALISSASSFAIASIDQDGALHGPDGPLIPNPGCFEARAFGPDGELRWRRPIARDAFAVLLSERAAGAPAGYRSVELPCCGIALVRRQLLWGRVLDSVRAPEGWVALAEARIGTVQVPRPDPAPAPREASEAANSPDVGHDRLQLVSHELIAIGPDANAYVADERLVAIEVARPASTTDA